MWAAAAATGAIGFSARRENRIEIEIATRWKSHFRVTTHARENSANKIKVNTLRDCAELY